MHFFHSYRKVDILLFYEQQRDTFIDPVITKIWAFQQRVFDLGDPSDWKTIVEQNREYRVEENCFAQELND